MSNNRRKEARAKEWARKGRAAEAIEVERDAARQELSAARVEIQLLKATAEGHLQELASRARALEVRMEELIARDNTIEGLRTKLHEHSIAYSELSAAHDDLQKQIDSMMAEERDLKRMRRRISEIQQQLNAAQTARDRAIRLVPNHLHGDLRAALAKEG